MRLGFALSSNEGCVRTMQAGPTQPRSGEALLLDAALQTIPFGFCVWSGNFTLVLWNQHYLDIYGFPASAVRRGMSLREMVDLSIAQGNHPGSDPQHFYDEYTRQLLANRSGMRAVAHEMIAGMRTLETAHVYAPGLGWVVTHEDVTEEIARSDMMDARKRELQHQYSLLDATINNISQGLSMFDGAMRLVTCNSSYAAMYGLPPELVRPGTRYEDILDYRLATGLHPPIDRDAFLAERLRIANSSTGMSEVIKTARGAYLSLRHQPLKGGGVVTTHEDITGQLAVEARMRHMATHDPLTDLPNRALFREELEKAFRSAAPGRLLALLAINLDHFKAVNDSTGHAVADKVLRKVAQRLVEIAGPEGMTARLGGDEFAIVLPGLAEPCMAAERARAIVMALSDPFVFGKKSIRLSASVGIAVAPGDARGADTLMNNADLALARAKAEGRATYHFFETGMDAALQRRRTLEAGLQGALDSGALTLAFQPLIDIASGQVAAAEALLRWSHPALGPVSPAEFIPLAEDSGLICAIGEWVLRSATQAAAAWPDPVHVSVNLSPIQFTRGDLVSVVRDALQASRLDPSRLELEITESLLLRDSADVLATLHTLRGLGVKIAMDDFGTGYSSLSYLRAFPFDKIKIDRSFMSDVAIKADSRAILKAMIGLGNSLGMVTVAEGVETAEQMAIVTAEGCTQVQGFFHSPPIDVAALSALIALPRRKAG